MPPKVRNPQAYNKFLEELLAKHGKGSADQMPSDQKAKIQGEIKRRAAHKPTAKKKAPPFIKKGG